MSLGRIGFGVVRALNDESGPDRSDQSSSTDKQVPESSEVSKFELCGAQDLLKYGRFS